MSVKIRTTLRIEGSLLIVMAVSMIIPLLIAFFERETGSIRAFLLVMAMSLFWPHTIFIFFGPLSAQDSKPG